MSSRDQRALAVLAIGRVLQVAIMLVGIRLSTHFLTAAEIGNLFVIVTITNFFGLFLINPVGQYINRFTNSWYAAGTLLNKLFVYNFYVFFVVLLSFVVVAQLPAAGIGSTIDYALFVLVVAAFIYTNTWNQTIAPMLNLLGYRVVFTLLSVSSAAAAVLLSFLLVRYYQATGIMWVLGQAGAFLLMGVASLVCFVMCVPQRMSFNLARKDFNFKGVAAVARFALPLSISVLFLWMQGQSFRLVVESFLGVEYLGYMGIGLSIAAAVGSALESLIMQWVGPVIYRQMVSAEEFPRFFSRLINFILPIYLLMAMFVSFMSVFFIEILVGEKYMPSCVFLIIGIWCEFFRIATNLLATAAHSKMNTRILILPYAVGGLGTLLGVYLSVQSSSYSVLIPIVLPVMAGLALTVMYFQINSLLSVRLKVGGFLRLFTFGCLFALAVLLYPLSNKLIYAILISGVFGVYFLSVVLFYYRKQGGAHALNEES